MRVELKCAEQFTQGSDDKGLLSYVPGASIPDETWQKWQADTLANRLAGGFVKWETVQEPNAPTGEGDGDPAEMNKDQLLAYALRVYDATLDKRSNEKNLREQIALLAERARLVAVAELEKAAREREAAASTGGAGAQS